MGRGVLVLSLIAAGACRDVAPSAGPPASVIVRSTPPASAVATTASASPAARYELVADLQGTTGREGLLPAGGELSCRGRVVITVDMRTKPPLGLVTASFDIEMDSCPEGTVLTDGHVHAITLTAHPDRIHIDANVARPTPIAGNGIVVTSMGRGVKPNDAAEVIADPSKFGFFLHTERNPVGGAGRGVLRAR